MLILQLMVLIDAKDFIKSVLNKWDILMANLLPKINERSILSLNCNIITYIS